MSGELQVSAAYRAKDSTHRYLDWSVAVSDALAKRGITGDCAVLGAFGPQIAYLRHCRAADMHDGLGKRDKSGNVSATNVLRLRSQGLRVIVVRSRPPATPGVTWWQLNEIAPNGRNRVYLDQPQPGARPYAAGVE